MVNIVSEACFREILSHASGGNWRARHTKYLRFQSKNDKTSLTNSLS